MKSEVECTLGFNCSSVATGTPDLAEITPKVSPACTVQNRFAGGLFAVVVAAVLVTTCLRGVDELAVVTARGEPPASTPERISTTAIVAAARNAAGAT
jgi:hypothetical protein